LPLLLPSVAEAVSSELNNVIVLPAETSVSVGVGTNVEVLPVAVGDAVVVLLLSRRTIKLSNSGSHRGQGHAVVNVERNKKIIEYNCRFREVRIVCILVLTPLELSDFPPNPPKISSISKIYIRVRTRRKDILNVSFKIVDFVVGSRIEMVFLFLLEMPLQCVQLNPAAPEYPIN